MTDSRYFYRDLPAIESFAEAMETHRHVSVPDDWWIVIADVIGSTKVIEAGDYKKVNTVGMACIAVVVNVDEAKRRVKALDGAGVPSSEFLRVRR